MCRPTQPWLPSAEITAQRRSLSRFFAIPTLQGFARVNNPLPSPNRTGNLPHRAAECSGLLSWGSSLGKDGQDSWRVTTTLTLAQKGELERIAAREG